MGIWDLPFQVYCWFQLISYPGIFWVSGNFLPTKAFNPSCLRSCSFWVGEDLPKEKQTKLDNCKSLTDFLICQSKRGKKKKRWGGLHIPVAIELEVRAALSRDRPRVEKSTVYPHVPTCRSLAPIQYEMLRSKTPSSGWLAVFWYTPPQIVRWHLHTVCSNVSHCGRWEFSQLWRDSTGGARIEPLPCRACLLVPCSAVLACAAGAAPKTFEAASVEAGPRWREHQCRR